MPLYLIGYRETANNMSSDYLSMRRSGVEAFSDIEIFAIDVARPIFWWPRARVFGQLFLEYVKRGRWGDALVVMMSKSSRNPILPLYVPCLISDRFMTKLKENDGNISITRK